jgi:hypothetical protein
MTRETLFRMPLKHVRSSAWHPEFPFSLFPTETYLIKVLLGSDLSFFFLFLGERVSLRFDSDLLHSCFNPLYMGLVGSDDQVAWSPGSGYIEARVYFRGKISGTLLFSTGVSAHNMTFNEQIFQIWWTVVCTSHGWKQRFYFRYEPSFCCPQLPNRTNK